MLIRPGTMDEEESEPPIIGSSVGATKVIERLAPGLEIAWPDHPTVPEDLKAFLEGASARLYAAADGLKDEPGFVPAAGFTRNSRDLFFEHVKAELEDVRGGIETEYPWEAFDALDATAPIRRLTRAGLLIKLRALGAFILFGATRRDDEMTAADFFPMDAWKGKRNAEIAEILMKELGFANKQVAHITLTRPLPEDIELYAGSGRPQFERIVGLFTEFDRAVDRRLPPDWWSEWFSEFRRGLS